MPEQETPIIRRHHHITLCVGTAQEDYDFHTQVLSLKSVKKTALYDGVVPVYHLYYGNDLGEESTLVTSFPMRQSGRLGRRGSGQVKSLALSVPESALGFWNERLSAHGFTVKEDERFGDRALAVRAPLRHSLRTGGRGRRRPDALFQWGGPVGVRHTWHPRHHRVGQRRRLSADFIQSGWTAHLVGEEHDRSRFELDQGGTGRIIDMVVESGLAQGTWTFGEGTVHHCAFQVDDHAAQDGVKAHLEGLGYTDVSERRIAATSNRSTCAHPVGRCSRPPCRSPKACSSTSLTRRSAPAFQVPPVFSDQAEWILGYLEQLDA